MTLPEKADFLSDLQNLATSSKEQCLVCQDVEADLEHNNHLIIMPCGHVVCYDCAIFYFTSENTCPNCRTKLYVKPAQADDEFLTEDDGACDIDDEPVSGSLMSDGSEDDEEVGGESPDQSPDGHRHARLDRRFHKLLALLYEHIDENPSKVQGTVQSTIASDENDEKLRSECPLRDFISCDDNGELKVDLKRLREVLEEWDEERIENDYRTKLEWDVTVWKLG